MGTRLDVTFAMSMVLRPLGSMPSSALCTRSRALAPALSVEKPRLRFRFEELPHGNVLGQEGR